MQHHILKKRKSSPTTSYPLFFTRFNPERWTSISLHLTSSMLSGPHVCIGLLLRYESCFSVHLFFSPAFDDDSESLIPSPSFLKFYHQKSLIINPIPVPLIVNFKFEPNQIAKPVVAIAISGLHIGTYVYFLHKKKQSQPMECQCIRKVTMNARGGTVVA